MHCILVKGKKFWVETKVFFQNREFGLTSCLGHESDTTFDVIETAENYLKFVKKSSTMGVF